MNRYAVGDDHVNRLVLGRMLIYYFSRMHDFQTQQFRATQNPS